MYASFEASGKRWTRSSKVNANTRNKTAHACLPRSKRQASDGHAQVK